MIGYLYLIRRNIVLIYALFLLVGVLSTTSAQAPIASSEFEQITSSNIDQLVRVATLEVDSPVGQVSFSPVEPILVATSGKNYEMIHIWNFSEATVEHMVLEGHTDLVINIVFSMNGETLASVSRDGTLRLWDMEHYEEKLLINADVTYTGGIDFNADGSLLVSAAYGGEMYLWDVETGNQLRTLITEALEWAITDVAFGPTDNLLVSSSFTGITLWNFETGEELTTPYIYGNAVDVVNFDNDGNILAFGTDGGDVYLWDVETHMLTQIQHDGAIYFPDIVFSPDGTLLASSDNDNKIWFWDAKTGNALTVLQEVDSQEGTAGDIAFNFDGTLFASGHENGTIQLWGVPSD